MPSLSKSQLLQESLEIEAWAQPRQIPVKLDTMVKAVNASGLAAAEPSQDMGVGNTFGGDGWLPPLEELSSFGSWQSVASTIMHKAGLTSSFNSGSTAFDAIIWMISAMQFSTMPFFSSFVSGGGSVSISSLSLGPAIQQVSALTNEFVTSDTFNQIVTSLRKIAQLAIANRGNVQKDSYQQQGVLSVKGGSLYLGTLRTTIQMEYKTGKGYEQLHQQITISRMVGALDFDKCKRNAAILLSWDGRNVDDWVNGTASASQPPNDSPAWWS